jgi:hypothetical protein
LRGSLRRPCSCRARGVVSTELTYVLDDDDDDDDDDDSQHYGERDEDTNGIDVRPSEGYDSVCSTGDELARQKDVGAERHEGEDVVV